MKKSITKSKSGHYTATLNGNFGWHLFKAVKVNTLANARFILNEAEKAIINNSYKEFKYQGNFVESRINHHLSFLAK